MIENDFLLLINSLLGVFAGMSNGYSAVRVGELDQRILRASMSILSAIVGISYGMVLLGYIAGDSLGPVYLRPVLSIFLVAVAVSPLIYGRDDVTILKNRIDEMSARITAQDEEIWRLNEVIKTMIRQFSDLNFVSTHDDGVAKKKKEDLPVVLVISVDPTGLKIREEVDAIFDSGMRYEYLSFPVSRNMIINEMERIKPDAVHILGHMSASGIGLSDGVASMGWWRRLFDRYGVDFVFANGCESIGIVDAIFVDGVKCVVGVRSDVKDDAALEFARQFYGWMAAGKMATESTELAKMALGHVDAEQVVVRGNWSYR